MGRQDDGTRLRSSSPSRKPSSRTQQRSKQPPGSSGRRRPAEEEARSPRRSAGRRHDEEDEVKRAATGVATWEAGVNKRCHKCMRQTCICEGEPLVESSTTASPLRCPSSPKRGSPTRDRPASRGSASPSRGRKQQQQACPIVDEAIATGGYVMMFTFEWSSVLDPASLCNVSPCCYSSLCCYASP